MMSNANAVRGTPAQLKSTPQTYQRILGLIDLLAEKLPQVSLSIDPYDPSSKVRINARYPDGARLRVPESTLLAKSLATLLGDLLGPAAHAVLNRMELQAAGGARIEFPNNPNPSAPPPTVVVTPSGIRFQHPRSSHAYPVAPWYALSSQGPSARYQTVGPAELERVLREQGGLSSEEVKWIEAAARVWPRKLSAYVLNLVDWDAVKAGKTDPMFTLLFPQKEMFSPSELELLERGLESGDRSTLERTAIQIRAGRNPHPAGQEQNVPRLRDGTRVSGVQHKYPETALLFPRNGQTCHAYCSYCFRWPQFVKTDDHTMKFAGGVDQVPLWQQYLRENPGISDVLITGGDPMIMKTSTLAAYVQPLLNLDTVTNLRFGTRALTFFPDRFADPHLLALFEDVRSKGKQVHLMAHIGHERELQTPAVQSAILSLRETGAVLRSQAPLIRGINDSPKAWADKWRAELNAGIVPYYMFMERDTGAHEYFAVPIAKALTIYQEAIRQVTGLGRTARGPSMSAGAGKIHVVGHASLGGQPVLVFKFLQCRDPDMVGQLFYGKACSRATWIHEVEPVVEDACQQAIWDLIHRYEKPTPSQSN